MTTASAYSSDTRMPTAISLRSVPRTTTMRCSTASRGLSRCGDAPGDWRRGCLTGLRAHAPPGSCHAGGRRVWGEAGCFARPDGAESVPQRPMQRRSPAHSCRRCADAHPDQQHEPAPRAAAAGTSTRSSDQRVRGAASRRHEHAASPLHSGPKKSTASAARGRAPRAALAARRAAGPGVSARPPSCGMRVVH